MEERKSKGWRKKIRIQMRNKKRKCKIKQDKENNLGRDEYGNKNKGE
jgi:hypothetical protein